MGSHCEAMRTEIQNLVLQVHLHRSNYRWIMFECIKHVKSIFTQRCAHCTTRGVVVCGEATKRSGCQSVKLRTSVHTTVMSALCSRLHMSWRPCVLWPIALPSVPSRRKWAGGLLFSYLQLPLLVTSSLLWFLVGVFLNPKMLGNHLFC